MDSQHKRAMLLPSSVQWQLKKERSQCITVPCWNPYCGIPSVFSHCWLGVRKGIRSVETCATNSQILSYRTSRWRKVRRNWLLSITGKTTLKTEIGHTGWGGGCWKSNKAQILQRTLLAKSKSSSTTTGFTWLSVSSTSASTASFLTQRMDSWS